MKLEVIGLQIQVTTKTPEKHGISLRYQRKPLDPDAEPKM